MNKITVALLLFITLSLNSYSKEKVMGNNFEEVSSSLEKLLKTKTKEEKEVISDYIEELGKEFKKIYIQENIEKNNLSESYKTNFDFEIKNNLVVFLNNKTIQQSMEYFEYYKITKDKRVFNLKNSEYDSELKLSGEGWIEISDKILKASENLNFVDQMFIEISIKNYIEIAKNYSLEKNSSLEEEMVIMFNKMKMSDLLKMEVGVK